MLDIKFIRENKDAVKKNCKLRNIKCDIDRLLELYEEAKKLLWRTEDLRLEKNKLNDEIQKASDDRKKLIIAKGKKIKEDSDEAEAVWKEKNTEFLKGLLRVPNMSHPNSPIGKDDSENKEIEKHEQYNGPGDSKRRGGDPPLTPVPKEVVYFPVYLFIDIHRSSRRGRRDE